MAFARAERTTAQHPRPRLDRIADEDEAAFALRVQTAQAQWASELLGMVREDYRVAADLATALVANEPTASHFRLLARAERGRRNRKVADHAESFAFFLEALDHLAHDRRREAGDRLVRALRTNPALLDDVAIPEAIRAFLKAHPEARPAARDLFRPHPPFAKAVEDD